MDIVEESEKLLKEENKKYEGVEMPEILVKKASKLSEEFDADKEVVLTGIYLMDLKTAEAFEKGKLEEHIEMGIKRAREFLEKFEISEKRKKKILDCIKFHHGSSSYPCIEAEICANVDCYRFLHPEGFLEFFSRLKNMKGFEMALKVSKEKIEEKHEILSLGIPEKELEKFYHMFKDILNSAENN